MATRSNIHFKSNGKTWANVYVHYDGYPENRLPEIQEFFKDVLHWTKDTRFNDPSYLASKFVVWYATRGEDKPSLDFLGIGVATEDSGDIDYRYAIHCDEMTAAGTPKVTYEKV